MSAEAGPTYWQLVVHAAKSFPDRVVLADDYGRAMTTSDLCEASLATAAALHDRGVRAGSIVSWQLPSTLEAMVVMVALARLGAVQNPVLPIWRENEVRFTTEQLSTDFVIVPRVWRGFDHEELARTVAADRAMQVIVIDHSTPRGPGLRLPTGDPDSLPLPPKNAAEARWIYYSSGTTAAPKGARHCDASVIAGSTGVIEMTGVTSADVNPIAFPITHIGGAVMLVAALKTGMRLALFDSFDPATTPHAIAAHNPTLLGSATPFLMALMVAQQAHGPEPLYPNLRGCVGGGAPITTQLQDEVRRTFGVPGVANAWGLTEFPVAASQTPDACPQLLDRTVGRPVPGVTVRVVDEGEHVLARGEEGELRLKGPQCFLGYVDSTLDALAFDGDGWFRTGDLGRIDEHGNVVVTGRIKDAIIRNAENISALEIETVLAGHPAVADVAVIGVPDSRTGERVCAVVVARPGEALTLDVLVAHCQARGLSKHKSPERLEVVGELPRNVTGKVLKTALRERFASTKGR